MVLQKDQHNLACLKENTFKILYYNCNPAKCLCQARTVVRQVYMYMCDRGIDFTYFCDISVRFWNCTDSMVFLVFILFMYTTFILALL